MEVQLALLGVALHYGRERQHVDAVLRAELLEAPVRIEEILDAELRGERVAQLGIGMHLDRVRHGEEHEARAVALGVLGGHADQAFGDLPGFLPEPVLRRRQHHRLEPLLHAKVVAARMRFCHHRHLAHVAHELQHARMVGSAPREIA